MEQLNLGNDGVKSSRRRLSSILKAPRTSMRVPGSEQEEQQEDVTKTIEKKRNSRRVSFAATKNVRVFSKDSKGESPVLATLPNTAVGDRQQDEKILRFVEEGNHQIKGLDTLLNTPLYVSQHLSRENFFSDPVLQDDCVDRTMLLGEDTGYMDMTHSHTITIDKDYENDEVNPDVGLKTAQNVAGPKGLSCDTKVETKTPTMDSDFNAFLASISLPTVKNIVPSSSKKELAGFICSTDTSASEIDKENHLPPFLMKQTQHPVSNSHPQQPLGLQRRRSRVAFSEDNDMEVTTSHTVIIENKSNAQPVLSFGPGNNGSVASTSAFSHDDDMELTQSQTAAINVKLTGNISCNIQSALDHNRSHYFSENDDAMEMTGLFDVSRRGHAISMNEGAPISKVSKMSSFTVAGNREGMDRNKPGNFHSNLSIIQTDNSDDMEMTEALDVSVQEKEHTASVKRETLFLQPKMSKKPFNVFGSGEIMNQNKSSHPPTFQTANSDDMEMTQCQTIVLEAKQFSEDKPLSNSRKSLSHAPISSSVYDKDHAASMKEEDLLQIHRPGKMSSINVVRNEDIMDNLSTAPTSSSDDMEMTEALDVSVQEKAYTVSINEKVLLPFPQIIKKTSFNLTGNGQMMDPNKSGLAQTDISDDMEMTQCQTIVLEAKQFSKDKPLSNPRKSLPHGFISSSVKDKELAGSMKREPLLQIHKPRSMSFINKTTYEELMHQNKSSNLSMDQTANSDDMEMTEALDVSVQEKEYTVASSSFKSLQFPQIHQKPTFTLNGNEQMMDQNKSYHLPIAQTANTDDMEMTRCQTIVLEAKQVSIDKPLSNSRKSHTLPSETESGDGMDMTQTFTGRIVLNSHSASKRAGGQSILLPAMSTSSKHNQSVCTDITGNPSTFAGIAFPSPDEMELTGCATVNIDSNRTWLAGTSTKRAPSFANQTITVAEPMEMTEVHMLPASERKAFMPRRKSITAGRGLMSFCGPKNIQADNISNPDDMEMTQCQTVVLEAENYSKPSGKLVAASSRSDVDGMEMTQALTGDIMLKSLISSDENLLPTAQSHQILDQSDCTKPVYQVSTSGLFGPCVDDDMEFTGCNTIAIDTQKTSAATGTMIKASESAHWASTSVSSEEQNEVSDAANHSKHIPFTLKADTNLTYSNTDTKSYGASDMQMNRNLEMAHPSNAMTTDESVYEDHNMQVSKVITMPIETQDTVKGQSANSVQLELSSAESVADSFIKEELQHAKSRRRSLAEIQMELQNMSRRINEDVLKEATAPLPSYSLSEIGKEKCETATSTKPASNVTPNLKEKDKSFQNEKSTPFSLKKQPFSSRVSFSGIVPKLPKRAMATTPNKTVTLSTHSLQYLPLEKHLDVKQNSNCDAVNINDEELPEMSSEEDLSGSLENWQVHKDDERVDSSVVLLSEEPLENDVFEPDLNTSQGLKRQYLEETNVTAEQTKKAYISDMEPDCHESGVQWEGNFRAAPNPIAKTIEDTGVSESTFRNSQYDSHVDGTLDYDFDFNKKLEDGSITVNEFLSHFGINFVIHRSRPSALPDSCRAGETRTMEDLLKEKYIYLPKQRMYEQDCKELTDIVERLKEQMPEQEKSLRCINEALQQEICSLSKEKLKSFGSVLKARRVYFGKRSKALSHEMKGVLYAELVKTAKDAKLQLMGKIKETDEMMEDLDGCIKDIETELAAIDAVIVGNHHDSPQTRPALKAKEDDLQKLNTALTETEREMDELQIQSKTLEGQEQKLQEECAGFKSHLATLNSLNEWRLDETDERGALFTFLHNTVHMQVKLQTPAGKEWMTEDEDRNMDVSLRLQLDVGKSECHASMIHKLLALHNRSQAPWMQKYPTTRHIPELLHDVSLMVGRLRLLGEEIHRLKKWGGLRLCIRQITCVDTKVHIIFSSLKAFEKFELSLMVTPDYPFGPLQIQDFRSHTGNIRLSQIEDTVSSVKPGKNYLTNVLKNIHSDHLR